MIIVLTIRRKKLKGVWVYDPHSGGISVPQSMQDVIRKRIIKHADNNYSGKFTRIDVIFRGKFCYIDAYTEPFLGKEFDQKLYGESREERIDRLRNIPTHLCRLRYFGDIDKWSMAFYTYSNERDDPCMFNTGTLEGTLEEAFDTASVYLID